jgi:hypothetical protein
MANIPQTTYSNIPAYPKSWYWQNINWSAKTVSVAADRYKLTSPSSIQVDVGGVSLTNVASQELDLSLDATWDFGQSTVGTWAAGHSYSVGDWVRPATAGGDGANNVSVRSATPQMTSNTTPSPYVAYATSQYGTYQAYKAFIGLDVSGNLWLSSNTNLPQVLRIDLGAGNALIINKFQYTSDLSSRGPKTYTIEGSNDNFVSDTNVLYTGTNVVDVGYPWVIGSGYKTFVNTTAYRYYQINVTVSQSIDLLLIKLFQFVAAPSLLYRCTSQGTSLASEPTWATTVGGETSESGGPTWTCYYDDTVASNRAGQDFYIYSCVGTSVVPDLVVSRNSTIPEGYTALTSRKIGGFHCLCASTGALYSTWVTGTAYGLGATVIPTVANGLEYRCISAHTSGTQPTWPITTGTVDSSGKWVCESLHPLNNYLTGDILPSTVWDLKRKSSSGSNVGLAYIAPLDDWWAIYLASGTATAPVSVYGATILDTIDWNNSVDAGRAVGMRLPRDAEFQIAASLSNEQTNIYGSADPVTTGGHVDTAGRRMISAYGLEDCLGVMYQWLDEQSYRFDGATAHTHVIAGSAPTTSNAASADVAPAWAWYDLPGDKGQLYRQGTYGDIKMLAGGNWYISVCGSRCRSLYHHRWTVSSDFGFRLVARSQNK